MRDSYVRSYQHLRNLIVFRSLFPPGMLVMGGGVMGQKEWGERLLSTYYALCLDWVLCKHSEGRVGLAPLTSG